MTLGMSPWDAATQMFQPPGPGRGGGSIGLSEGSEGIEVDVSEFPLANLHYSKLVIIICE